MSDKKFCRQCGKPLIKMEEKTFNEETGKPNYRMVCPEQKCSHTGWNHLWVSKYQSTIISFFSDKIICQRCGVEAWPLW